MPQLGAQPRDDGVRHQLISPQVKVATIVDENGPLNIFKNISQAVDLDTPGSQLADPAHEPLVRMRRSLLARLNRDGPFLLGKFPLSQILRWLEELEVLGAGLGLLGVGTAGDTGHGSHHPARIR